MARTRGPSRWLACLLAPVVCSGAVTACKGRGASEPPTPEAEREGDGEADGDAPTSLGRAPLPGVDLSAAGVRRGPRLSAGAGPAKTGAGAMTAAQLIALATDMADDKRAVPQAQGRAVQMSYRGVVLLLVVDAQADRMRVLAPIMEVGELGRDELAILMQANFHTALDARYAVSEGVVYSLYVHPLSNLDERSLRSALDQVSALVETFGSTFSSTDVVFGG